uniref:Uncharacterized protein n=1 Tax=Heliothis virescens TaxID=7102 RepID=A0A2A4J286_HELVI
MDYFGVGAISHTHSATDSERYILRPTTGNATFNVALPIAARARGARPLPTGRPAPCPSAAASSWRPAPPRGRLARGGLLYGAAMPPIRHDIKRKVGALSNKLPTLIGSAQANQNIKKENSTQRRRESIGGVNNLTQNNCLLESVEISTQMVAH